MKRTIRSPSVINGTIVLPGDKSISQRALLLNAVAIGTAHVSNICEGDDRKAILQSLDSLGIRIDKHSFCPISKSEECFEIVGAGPDGLREPNTIIDASNSGTTMRLLSGLLAAQSFFSVISGDQSLINRPMSRIVEPLRLMNAKIMGRGNDSLAPLAIKGGNLQGITYTTPVASAQVKSCLLIAGLYAHGKTTIIEPSLSRDHTERMLRSMGATIGIDGLEVSITSSNLSPLDINVPGDISSAAFWMITGCCHPNAKIRLEGVGINPTRAGVIKILESMGAKIQLENLRKQGNEPVADIIVESSDLRGTEIEGDMIPQVVDELPVIAIAASQAKGTTIIKDSYELRVKESDRISATVTGLSKLGANVKALPDGMIINGDSNLVGAQVSSYGDHRITMSMAVAGLIAKGETVIDGAESANISYPGFWDTLESIAPQKQD